MSRKFTALLVVALLTISTSTSAITLPERQPDTPETTPACNALDSCVCSTGGSCVDVCADTWCTGSAASDACFRCIVQDQTAQQLGCGDDYNACFDPPMVCESLVLSRAT